MHHLLPFLENFIAQYGLAALFVSVSLEALGAPLPGESAVMFASGAAATGELDIRAVAATAFVAAVVGDNAGYLIGRILGRATVARAAGRFGIGEAHLAKTEAAAHRFGPVMVVFARFVVILRQLNGIVAGTTGMRWPVFLAANMLGAALWVGLWSTLAYRLGHSVDIIPVLWHHLGLVAAIAVPLLIAAMFVVWWRVRRHRNVATPR